MNEPNFDKTLNASEISPENIMPHHTATHAAYNKILNGEVLQNITIEDIKKVHDIILKKYSEFEMEHPHIDKLDEVENIKEEVKEEKPNEEFSKFDALNDHAQLHEMWSKFRETETDKIDGYDKENVIDMHKKLLKIMEDNGLSHSMVDDLDGIAEDKPKRIFLSNLLDSLGTGNGALRRPFVLLAGNICDNGFTDGKIDILINLEEKRPRVEQIVKEIFPEKYRTRLNFIYATDLKSVSNNIRLFDLVALRYAALELRTMSKPKTNKKIESKPKEKLNRKKNETPKKHSTVSTTTLPSDVSKSIAQIPITKGDIVKSIKDYGCPYCKSKNVRLLLWKKDYTGFKLGCIDCGKRWSAIKQKENLSIERKLQDEPHLDTRFIDLLDEERSLFNKVNNVFSKMEKHFVTRKYSSDINSEKISGNNIIDEENQYEFSEKEMENLKRNMSKKRFVFETRKLQKGISYSPDELITVVNGEMMSTAESGAKKGMTDIGKKFVKLSPGLKKYISTYSLKLATDINDDIVKNVQVEVLAGMKKNEGVDAIRRRISNVFTEGTRVKVAGDILKPHIRHIPATRRATLIAQTEVLRAFNTGRMDAYNQNKNIIKGWRFLASGDERTCAICNDLDGREFSLGDETNMPPNPHVSCFLDSRVPIFTSKGYKPIGKIKVNDLVLTHKGRFKPVTKILEKLKYNGESIRLFVEWESVKKMPKKFSIAVTPEHPIFIDSDKSVNASKLKVGDNIFILGKECEQCNLLFPLFKLKENYKYHSLSCANIATANEQYKDVHQHTLRSKNAIKQMEREYRLGTRDRFKITKNANKKIKELFKDENWRKNFLDIKSKMMLRVIKDRGSWLTDEGLQTLKNRKGIKNPMHKSKHSEEYWEKRRKDLKKQIKQYYLKHPEELKLKSINLKKFWRENPYSHANYKMAQKGFISKPQKEMFEIIKQDYPEAILEHPIKTKNHVRYADVAILRKKIVCEYDGSHWHQDKRKDLKRDMELREVGWEVLRFNENNYLDCLKEIKAICMNHEKMFKFLKLKIVKVSKKVLRKPHKLYNFAVKDDESYIANGFVVHNCRCTHISILR